MRRWNCGGFLGVCALGLGLGILIAAVFPVGCLMFLVAFLLIACGEDHSLEVPAAAERPAALLVRDKGINPRALAYIMANERRM